jgi:hypothetical protein
MIEFHEIPEVARETEEESGYYEVYWHDGKVDGTEHYRTFIGFAHFKGPDQWRLRYVLDQKDTVEYGWDAVEVAGWFAAKHGVGQRVFHDTTVHGE